ncbi:Elongator subunit elp4 [Coemansia spiralis]|uniref:Elongator complex protein 4 n=2 Tax=Coemansia TaxID=4863 RepID=A0A9W8G6P7_9FUNG|nr:Elongator complex protein 4 [Coemansia spiralis]KAJ1994580.1 Elongator subunit elp4 [Coemansia umbellata]KAJ2624386.1 Elongator subunit elp4 [Coemansia sp. RSA 1358]KAJ2677552.1 Elongator subunit elp4 [Coemansia spiralis]
MSSFRKRTTATQAKLPPATKINPHSAQLLVSTGVPSLDDVLGGGLPVGGVLLIEEDRQTGYSGTLLSYFASQAVAARHKLCIVSADQDVDLAAHLVGWPGVSRNSSGTIDASKSKVADIAKSEDGASDEAMKIAWRYQNLPKVNSDDNDNKDRNSQQTTEVPFCDRFDLSLRVPPAVIEKAQVEILDSDKLARITTSDSKHGGDMYKCVLDKIATLIEGGYSSLNALPPDVERNILRIELRSLGSGFWRGDGSTSILQFLHALRGLLRYSYATCVVSFPAYLYEDMGTRLPLVRRVEHLCDAVIELESFEGGYASPPDIVARQMKEDADAKQEYHGFLHIHKLPRLNSMTASMGRLSLLNTGGGSANNLAFRLRRKKFSIETYHLPIEGGVTERRVPSAKEESKPQPRTASAIGRGCGSTPGRKDPLEF